MKKIKVDLKPCPFCGGIPEVRQFANPKNWYYIECVDCRCRTDGYKHNRVAGTDEENIKANVDIWNRRDNWIPVSEQLPEEHKAISDKVLIAQGVHDKQISFGWLRNGIWVTSDMVPFVRQELITHWMPLPDKPVN